MTIAQLKEQREKILAGLSEARLQVARFEGALEFVNYLIEISAPSTPPQPDNVTATLPIKE